jgi:hypothetical protein
VVSISLRARARDGARRMQCFTLKDRIETASHFTSQIEHHRLCVCVCVCVCVCARARKRSANLPDVKKHACVVVG